MASTSLYILVSLLLSLVLVNKIKLIESCKDAKDASASLNLIDGLKSRAQMMTRFWRVFLYYCGPEKIEDAKLLAAENCSPRKLLNQTTVALCEHEILPDSTLEEKRRIRCSRKMRDDFYREFAKCYSEKNPHSTDEHVEKFWTFQSLSRDEKKDFVKLQIANYMDCYEQALKLT